MAGEIVRLADGLVRGTTIVPLFNPSGKPERQRQIAVSIVLCPRTTNQAVIEKNFERLMSTFVPLLTSQRVDSIAGKDDLESLASWLVARFRNRGIGAARLERVELMDDAGPSYSVTPTFVHRSREEADFVSLLQSCELVGHFAEGERYNTKSDADAIRKMIDAGGDKPIPLACFLCPPYVGEFTERGTVRYVGVHDEFDDDPASYNFDYHYRQYIDCVRHVAQLAETRAIRIAPVIVFSDWGLIAIDEIRKTLGSDMTIVSRLDRFRNGMHRYCASSSPRVEVTSFRELGVPDHLPLGLPMDGRERETWLIERARTSQDSTALTELLSYAREPDRLRQLLDWREFATIPPSDRAVVIDCLKVYHNICRLRFAALSSAEQQRMQGIETDNATELRYDAFVDAVLRMVQYQLYSRLFVEKFGPGICCYQDPGFTACGNLFRRLSFPVLFLDPERVLATS